MRRDCPLGGQELRRHNGSLSEVDLRILQELSFGTFRMPGHVVVQYRLIFVDNHEEVSRVPCPGEQTHQYVAALRSRSSCHQMDLILRCSLGRGSWTPVHDSIMS